MPQSTSPNNFIAQPACSRCQQQSLNMSWCIGIVGDPEQQSSCTFAGGEHMHLRCNWCQYKDDLMWTASNPKGH